MTKLERAGPPSQTFDSTRSPEYSFDSGGWPSEASPHSRLVSAKMYQALSTIAGGESLHIHSPRGTT